MSYYFKSYLTTFHGTYNKRTAMTGPIGSMARDYGDSPDFTHSVWEGNMGDRGKTYVRSPNDEVPRQVKSP